MASFKITVRGKRDDGFWPVYILVTHKSKIAYIKTDYVVSDRGLKKVYDSKGKESKELSEVRVLKNVLDIITDYVKRLNDVNSGVMSIQEVVDYLNCKDDNLLFTDFTHTYIGDMYLIQFEVDGDEYLTVKYINKSDTDGFVRLVSYNNHYGEKDVAINSIRALAIVKVSIRMNTMI